MAYLEILGYAAAILTTGAFIPQVYKAWREKSTKDVSLTMYWIMFLGLFLWFIYGYIIGSVPMALANALTGFLVLVMIFLKLKYK